jgi:hypothetical protein
MKLRTWIILGLAAVLTACIPSLKPFYTQQDIVKDPELLGVWEAAEGSDDFQRWHFEDAGEKGLTVTVTENKGKTGRFEGHLFQLGSQRFLDLLAKDCDFAPTQADLVAASLIPGHLLVRIERKDASLRLAFFDFDWLAKHLEENPASLAHHKEDDRLVLTAETPALQRFVQQHLDAGLFDESTGLSRAAAVAGDAAGRQ